MKNQDILRKITAQELGTKNVNTSFLMMPLRLETLFKDHVVEEIDEPERIFFTLKKAWELLCFMPYHYSDNDYNDEEEKQAVKLIKELHVEVEKLDMLYQNDKAILMEVLEKMRVLLPPKAEINDDWTVLIDKVKRLQSIDSMKCNRATALLNKLEHYTQILLNTCYKPPFNGYKRKKNDKEYSRSAIYKAGFKHFKECRKFITKLPQEIKKVPWFMPAQKRKLKRLLNQWNTTLTLSSEYDTYRYANEEKSVTVAMEYFDKEWEKLRAKLYTPEKVEKLINNIDCNNYIPYRYTKFVGLIFEMVIHVKKREGNRVGLRRENTLYNVLTNTIFDYQVQQDFTRELIGWVHKNLPEKLSPEVFKNYENYEFLPPTAVTWNQRYVYKKKMVYKKTRKCLCVRIYPDELAVTQNIRPLTKSEYYSGRDFWLKYIFYTDKATRESLWLGICDLWPAYRAAWIVRTTFPRSAFKVLKKRAADFRLEKKSFEEYAAEINENFLNAFPMTYVDDEQKVFDVPATDLLPERFILQVVLKTNDNKTTTVCKYGHRLPQTIQLGLDLNDLENAVDESTNTKGHLLLNGSMRWMTDYDEAERMGMAITLPLDQFAYERLTKKEFNQNKKNLERQMPGLTWDEKDKVARYGINRQRKNRSFFFDAVYVLGVNKESENECEKILTDLLEAHLYSDDGYSLLNIGTATNILTDEDQKTNAELFDTSDDALIEKYKHQPENCVNPVKLSSDEDLALLQQLFALKNSVLGNIKDKNNTLEHREILKSRRTNASLINKLDNKLVNLFKNNLELRDFLSNDVLARGPFPPIRIGNQPYGILPVCDFRNLSFDKESSLYILHKILIYLTEKWNAIAESKVSYCAENETITADDYLSIAGSTPISSYFQKVKAVKENSPLLLSSEFFKFTDVYGQVEGEQLKVIENILSLIGPRVTKEEIMSYLHDFDEIPIVEKDGENKYHCNFSNLQLPNLVSEIKTQLDELITATDEAKREQEVKNLIIEFFDLFAYRLDAWMMGLLSNKLRARIKIGKHRVALGSYGWVFNLKEPESININRQLDPEDEYLLAPSVNQAVTGAILRSAYNNSRLNGQRDYDLSVNLSSERVRNAIRIIEGVQNGLAIGTILGTDLERLMHDAYKDCDLELDEGIYNLRKQYPMVEDDKKNQDESTLKDNDITVINGAKLIEDYRKAKEQQSENDFVAGLNAFYDSTKIIGPDTAELIRKKNKRLLQLLDRIDDEYDALTDVILSEGVYKLTQGEREAVDALMQALDTGKNIPMPQVAEIPITSAQVDGNLVVALDTTAVADTKSLLANVEPKVDQWLKETIGGTDKVMLGFCEGEDNLSFVRMKELEVSASEMVYLSANKSTFYRYLELKNWLLRGYCEDYTNDFDIDNEDGTLKFDEIELTINNLRDMLASARILRNDDLVKETGIPDEALYETLQDKYDKTIEQVQVLVDNMSDMLEWQKALQDPEKPNYDATPVPDEKMREALQLAAKCFSIGQTTAMDAVNKNLFVGANTLYGDSKALLETVRLQHAFFEKMRTLHENLSVALKEAITIVSEATEKTYHTYTEAIQKVLVNNMLIVPNFVPDANVPLKLLDDQKSKTYFGNVKPFTVDENIQSLSKVSEQMMRFHQLRLFQKWNDRPDEIVPMQIPIIGDKHRWLGTEVESENYVNDAFTYMVVKPQNIPSHEAEKPLMAGIVLDHWIERIPYMEQTAGLAFTFDQPDAEAPQALLLAVSTKDSRDKYWSEDMLLRTVKSTVHLVKSRSVEPDNLKEHSWTSGLFPLIDYVDNP